MPGFNKRGPFGANEMQGRFGRCWMGQGAGPSSREPAPWFSLGFSGRMRGRCNRLFRGLFGRALPQGGPGERDLLLSRKRLLEEELKAVNERLAQNG